jgi:hypothetical protein
MKNKTIIILILVVAGLASRWLFKPGFFTMHDDLQIMRQLQMEKCWEDGQIPCRWVPDMGYGYGYPLFNFYPPLPFYVGQCFRLLGFSFVNIAKILFILQFVFSGIAMFVLASDLWGKWGGLISSVFYIWAPYHSVDVYVRGALNEAWAFIWFPLILWSAKKAAESSLLERKNSRSWSGYLNWLAFSFAMLLLTHNVMVMIFLPVLLVWVIYWWYKYDNWPWKNIKLFGNYVLSALWALGLAAFFTLPMFFEKNFTHIETMFSGYFDWRAHFISLRQMFTSRFWGYGPSVWADTDGMAFPVGHFHWILSLIVFVAVWVKNIKNWIKSRKITFSDWTLLITIFFSFTVLYSFLMHNQSTFIWLKITLLQLTQFPWRLLAGVVLFTSLISGYISKIWPQKWLVWFLIIGVIAWNWTYFRPQEMWPLTDKERFTGDIWKIQQTAGIYDYLPRTAKQAPTSAPDGEWEFLEGKAEVIETDQGSNWYYWHGQVLESGRLVINIFNFPGWRVWVNDQPAEIFYSENDDLGRNQVSLPAGEHEVYFQFTDTPIRKWSNLFSLLSWSLLLVLVSQRKWKWLPIE